jgi:hypothetical protein
VYWLALWNAVHEVVLGEFLKELRGDNFVEVRRIRVRSDFDNENSSEVHDQFEEKNKMKLIRR